MVKVVEQDYGAGLFVANLQSIIEKQCEQRVEEIISFRHYENKVNRNTSWAALKDRIVKLFIQPDDSFKILMELQNLFVSNLEPIRTDRHEKRTKVKRKPAKYRTFTNYRRAV